MKRTLITLLFTIILIQPLPAQNINEHENAEIDLSSVDCFIKMAKELSEGKNPDETEWKELSETGGYNPAVASEFRRSIYPAMMKYAFGPQYEHERDSILSIPYDDPDGKKTFSKVTLENYLKVKDKLKEVEDFRNAYDFNSIESAANQMLKAFLANPVDSLIYFPPVYFRFFECDAQVIDGSIMVMDFNLFETLSPEKRINLITHEMFHFYRSNFENRAFIDAYPLMQQIDKLQNEGIADLIDKDSGIEGGTETMKLYSDFPFFINTYSDAYNNPSDILRRLDSITAAYANNEIDKEEFESKVSNYFVFGGHPNGHNMVDMITKAGLKDELLKNFYSPFEFLRSYNKAAKIENGYVFSKEFMNYMETLEKEMLESNKAFFPMKKNEKMFFAMIKNEGTDKALDYYNTAKNDSLKLFTESGIISLGYEYMRSKDYETAILLFKMSVESYPESWNAYDSLGEAYLADGNKEMARTNYEKSLELNPNNNNAKEILKTL